MEPIEKIKKQIKAKKSLLCVGLDPDVEKMPPHLMKLENPVFEFNKQIIEATCDFAIAYKPNVAFFESLGTKGWEALELTISYLREKHPEVFTIADAKRCDIGNTARMYAKTFFENLNFDSITVSPYMGQDSILPFLEYKDKITIVLALTSNDSASDFQLFGDKEQCLYQRVIEKTQLYGEKSRLMYVVGATKAAMMKEVRRLAPNSFLLVPGIGAQAGNLKEVCNNALTCDGGLVINSSRAIIYASKGEDFAQKAREKAQELQMEMEEYLNKSNIL